MRSIRHTRNQGTTVFAQCRWNARRKYSRAWPQRTDAQRSELINTILRIVSESVNRWNGGFLDPSIEMANQQVIDQLVAQKYVVFHHNQTTRRDYGGFYGSG